MTGILNDKLQSQNADPQPAPGILKEPLQKSSGNNLPQSNVDNPHTSGGEETSSELTSFPQLNLVPQNTVVTTDMSDLSGDEGHLYGVRKSPMSRRIYQAAVSLI